jgi:hypothetical protein
LNNEVSNSLLLKIIYSNTSLEFNHPLRINLNCTKRDRKKKKVKVSLLKYILNLIPPFPSYSFLFSIQKLIKGLKFETLHFLTSPLSMLSPTQRGCFSTQNSVTPSVVIQGSEAKLLKRKRELYIWANRQSPNFQ